MAGLVRGRWEKRYINSFEDKDAYDQRRREHLAFRIDYAKEYVARHGCPDLGEDEKREIDDFWGRYGIDTGDYSWWSMYYWVTGARDPRFVPDHVMGLVLYAYYNDPAYVEAWRDKNEFDRLLPGMPFPETLLKCRRGRLALDGLSGSRVVSRSEAPIAVIALAGAGSEVIVKDSRHSGHGRGVRKYELNCAADVEKVLSDWEGSGNWIMQRAVRQHAGMAALNESSVNIYRIVTWRHGDEADVLFGAARFGAPGSITDDSYDENGVETTRCVAVGLDGCFAEQALDQDGFPVGRVSVGGGGCSWVRPGDGSRQARRAALGQLRHCRLGLRRRRVGPRRVLRVQHRVAWDGVLPVLQRSFHGREDRGDARLPFGRDEQAQLGSTLYVLMSLIEIGSEVE